MNFRARIYVFIVVLLIIFNGLYSQTKVKTISQIAEENGKAVVLIATSKGIEGELSLGSGFIVNSKGVIITNYHVIQGAYPALVKLTNGDIYDDISVVDTDERRDIAIIRIKGWNLPTVKLGNSDVINVGEKIVVIGNPQGLENTVTDGLISAKRDTEAGYKLHQISAPISPGSSGSPVFNMRGEVLGIATSSIIEGQNLNFSVPINYAQGMISENIKMSLEEFAKLPQVTHPFQFHDVKADNLKIFLEKLNSLLTKISRAHDKIIMGFFETLEPFTRPVGSKSFIRSNLQVSANIYIARELFLSIKEEIKEIKCTHKDASNLQKEYEEILDENFRAVDMTLSGLEEFQMNDVMRGMSKYMVSSDKYFEVNDEFLELIEEYHPELKKNVLPFILIPPLPAGGYPFYIGFRWALSSEKIIIIAIAPNSPAQQANLKIGDEIIGLRSGHKFNSVLDLDRTARNWKPGYTIHFRIKRGGEIIIVPVRLAKPQNSIM